MMFSCSRSLRSLQIALSYRTRTSSSVFVLSYCAMWFDDTSFPLDQIPIGFMNLDRNIVVFCHFALLPTNPHLSRNVKISSIV